MEGPAKIDEHTLHAWVDGRLDADDALRVQAALDADPALRAQATHFLRQNDALRAMLDDALSEPVPPALVRAARAGPPAAMRPAANMGRYAQAAAIVAALAVGAAGGWIARGDGAPAPEPLAERPDPLPLTRAAAVAHAAFTPEVRHPVEVRAAEQAHLVGWLSKRLGASLRLADLEGEGFRLVGGRLLPDASEGVAAQFMFEDAGGRRLTLFVRRDAGGSDTAFRYAQQDGLSTFYWIDRGFGYALSGEFPREAMIAVATSVYRQLNP